LVFSQQRKSQKRKADTTTPTANDQLSESSPVSSADQRPRRESSRPPKQPKREASQPDSQNHPGLVPATGLGLGLGPAGTASPKKQEQQLRYCAGLVKEMLSKKHGEYAWPFYKPVDAQALSLHDYHDIIKIPMDLCTIKVRPCRTVAPLASALSLHIVARCHLNGTCVLTRGVTHRSMQGADRFFKIIVIIICILLYVYLCK